MITVAEARELAAKRLRKQLSTWAGESVCGGVSAPVFELGLRPPTEKEVLRDQSAAEVWARSWRAAEVDAGAGEAARGFTIEWESRSWRAVGRQEIPVRMRITSPDELADFAGGDAAREWTRLSARVAEIDRRWGGSADEANAAVDDEVAGASAFIRVVRAQAKPIFALDDADFATLLDVVDWLAANPLGSMRPRQLPIRGVDSKWFGHHRSLVTALLGLANACTRLNILDAEATVRLRILDESMRPGGLRDVLAPVDQLARLPLSPHSVLVFENLESVMALPNLPGVVAVHGSGYAVDAVARIPWLTSAKVLYWGDLDSHGFAILGRLRSHVPAVRSILMDEDTLLAHRDLWVTEPKPFTGTVNGLTGSERRVLGRLRTEGNVRLEQERIPWSHALTVISALAGRPVR
ncbi:Wadjet anti-phage system protein JetD domain-containing protein [Brevibacterium sp.]|uniref:Wadjet anti-phage system protein JetD domain-containing protein n=1 Tax=Brevibacterium sp. TaxID=1701 RepID=UPI002810A2FA|nr:Wadjet anti-phage system protein JetD domain-containing protein [Brevibacterium sp.]